MPESLAESLANKVARVLSLSPSPSRRPGERIAYNTLESQAIDKDAFKTAVKWLKIADKVGPQEATNAGFAVKLIGRVAFTDEATALGLLCLAKNSPNATLSRIATQAHSKLAAQTQPAAPVEIAETPAPVAKDRYAPIILNPPIGARHR